MLRLLADLANQGDFGKQVRSGDADVSRTGGQIAFRLPDIRTASQKLRPQPGTDSRWSFGPGGGLTGEINERLRRAARQECQTVGGGARIRLQAGEMADVCSRLGLGARLIERRGIPSLIAKRHQRGGIGARLRINPRAGEAGLSAAQIDIRVRNFGNDFKLQRERGLLRRGRTGAGGFEAAAVAAPEIDLPAGVEADIEQVKGPRKIWNALHRDLTIGAEFIARRRTAGVDLREEAPEGNVAIGARLPDLSGGDAQIKIVSRGGLQ